MFGIGCVCWPVWDSAILLLVQCKIFPSQTFPSLTVLLWGSINLFVLCCTVYCTVREKGGIVAWDNFTFSPTNITVLEFSLAISDHAKGTVHIVRKQCFDLLTSPCMQNDIIGTEYLGVSTVHSFENPSSMCVQFVLIVSLFSTHLSKHFMVCEAQPKMQELLFF